MRNTPQTQLVITALSTLGHATNQQLFHIVEKQLPGTTLPSVHRITTRLVDQKIIQTVLVNDDAMVFDTNPVPHDHFICLPCGKIKDVELGDDTYRNLQASVGTTLTRGSLTIRGICRNCEEIK